LWVLVNHLCICVAYYLVVPERLLDARGDKCHGSRKDERDRRNSYLGETVAHAVVTVPACKFQVLSMEYIIQLLCV
jgi:hypothetical protein